MAMRFLSPSLPACALPSLHLHPTPGLLSRPACLALGPSWIITTITAATAVRDFLLIAQIHPALTGHGQGILRIRPVNCLESSLAVFPEPH